ADHVGHLGSHLLVLRRKEMDHSLQPHGQFPKRRRRANGQRLEIGAGRLLHGGVLPNVISAVSLCSPEITSTGMSGLLDDRWERCGRYAAMISNLSRSQ